MPQRIWRKEGARLHDEQGGTAERGDERQTWPVERERLPAAENSASPHYKGRACDGAVRSGCLRDDRDRSGSAADPAFARTVVASPTPVPPGTIVIDPGSHFLYLVQGGGQAIRYGVGVGGEGFGWSGSATVHSKQEWPDWYPPAEMLQRKPELRAHMTQLQSGIGMPGGSENPIGARALYLWQGNKDTLYRIHGTNEPWTIGQNVSSGCIRLTNDDIVDLYDRIPTGTKVVVLATAYSAPVAPGTVSVQRR
jgi:lipoprotein-anchoring transpeptidase ErfK/SrfK